MKKIQIVSISRVKQDFILKGEEEYKKRISKFVDLKIEEYNLNFPSSYTKEDVMKEEGEYFLKRVPKNTKIILLDERGKNFTSYQFAEFLKKQDIESNNLCFAIGGAFGWHEDVKKKASMLLSLSNFTFPYQLSRLIMVEQVYRAYSIINNLPYHKE